MDKNMVDRTCARCGNDGVRIFKKEFKYIMSCKFCEKRKIIPEENWQGLDAELNQFDCEPIKNN